MVQKNSSTWSIVYSSFHTVKLERHVKLVTEASSQVCGIDRRDGLIRQKLKSRQIMKKFHSKHHFNV